MSYKSVAIIGCGNLGVSILEGLLVSKNYSNAQISVTRRNTEQLQKYAEKGVYVTSDNIKAIDWGIPPELISMYRYGHIQS